MSLPLSPAEKLAAEVRHLTAQIPRVVTPVSPTLAKPRKKREIKYRGMTERDAARRLARLEPIVETLLRKAQGIADEVALAKALLEKSA